VPTQKPAIKLENKKDTETAAPSEECVACTSELHNFHLTQNLQHIPANVPHIIPTAQVTSVVFSWELLAVFVDNYNRFSFPVFGIPSTILPHDIQNLLEGTLPINNNGSDEGSTKNSQEVLEAIQMYAFCVMAHGASCSMTVPSSHSVKTLPQCTITSQPTLTNEQLRDAAAQLMAKAKSMLIEKYDTWNQYTAGSYLLIGLHHAALGELEDAYIHIAVAVQMSLNLLQNQNHESVIHLMPTSKISRVNFNLEFIKRIYICQTLYWHFYPMIGSTN